jgi:hypothetical protein
MRARVSTRFGARRWERNKLEPLHCRPQNQTPSDSRNCNHSNSTTLSESSGGRREGLMLSPLLRSSPCCRPRWRVEQAREISWESQRRHTQVLIWDHMYALWHS